MINHPNKLKACHKQGERNRRWREQRDERKEKLASRTNSIKYKAPLLIRLCRMPGAGGPVLVSRLHSIQFRPNGNSLYCQSVSRTVDATRQPMLIRVYPPHQNLITLSVSDNERCVQLVDGATKLYSNDGRWKNRWLLFFSPLPNSCLLVYVALVVGRDSRKLTPFY